jgi:hypothetical protein
MQGGHSLRRQEETAMNKKTANWLVLVSVVIALVAFVAAVSMPAEARPINCRFVSCPPPACEFGEHTEVPPGQCCPVCVPD